MSSKSPSVHSVHIYQHDSDLISRLCDIVSSPLKNGGAVLIIATPEHRNQIAQELADCGVDVLAYAREGQFIMVDAEEMLATFMRNGTPDRDRFMTTLGELLGKARAAACSRAQGLTVFGEMVAVLWDKGEKQAALEVEALWNDALSDRAFHLHCAYPRTGFINEDEARVCAHHDVVIH